MCAPKGNNVQSAAQSAAAALQRQDQPLPESEEREVRQREYTMMTVESVCLLDLHNAS